MRLHAHEWGDANAPLLVCLHGVTSHGGRFRRLAEVLSVLVLRVLGATATRPRPFGVAIATSWGGWALPSLQVTLFAAGLVAIAAVVAMSG